MPKYEFSIEVESSFLPEHSDPEQGHFAFSYTITVHNTGDVAAQLVSRHWVVEDAQGQMEEIKGLGVVGHQPLLEPGEAFQYTSGCHLETPGGPMRGSYFCVAEDGTRFEVPIPPFELGPGNTGSRAHVLH